MASHPWLDESAAPLFQHNYPADGTPEETRAFGDLWDRTIRAWGRPYGIVADLTRVIGASAGVRKAMSDTDKMMADVDARWCVASALVVANTFVRGLVMAVFWVTPPVYPYRFFSNVEDARAWVLARLAEKGVTRP